MDESLIWLHDTYSEGDKKRIADIYEAIWLRSIQSCMCAYEYKHVDVFFSAPQEKNYRTSLEIPLVEGFMRFSSDTDSDSDTKKKETSFQEKQIQRNGRRLG
jgi:DNA topoisomerase IA